MPDHSSWFTYLLALPNFQALWAMVNKTGCVNNDLHADQTPQELEQLATGAQCAEGYHLTALPRHFSYPENTPVTLEPFTVGVFVCLIIALMVFLTRARVLNTQAAVIPEAELTTASFMENFVEIFYGLLRDTLGKKDAAHFLPIIGTCACFIFFSNVLALVPGFSPPTSNFNVTLACGLVVFLTSEIYGIIRQGPIGYIKHFMGPTFETPLGQVPLFFPLLFPLEIISHLVRPLSLAIRLCANLFADHLVVGVFTSLVFVLVPVPLMVLGVLVVVLQTYVFCLLATVYIQLGIEHSEGHAKESSGQHGHGENLHA